jgi:putative ATP-dependent endonuclease of the OLD family
MQIAREGRAPVRRLRLDAWWEDDGTVEGEVSQELFWVDTLDDAP